MPGSNRWGQSSTGKQENHKNCTGERWLMILFHVCCFPFLYFWLLSNETKVSNTNQDVYLTPLLPISDLSGKVTQHQETAMHFFHINHNCNIWYSQSLSFSCRTIWSPVPSIRYETAFWLRWQRAVWDRDRLSSVQLIRSYTFTYVHKHTY